MTPRTLFDKSWHPHVLTAQPDGTTVVYIDRHFVHDATGPQAFERLRLGGREGRRPQPQLPVADHNVPATDRSGGGAGHVIEHAGPAIQALSMEGRMTVCNMSIEAGARAGLIAPDQTTFDYLAGRPGVPKAGGFEQAVQFWRTLPSDAGARYDK